MTLCEQTTTIADRPHTVTLTWNHDGLLPLAQTEKLADSDGNEIDSRFFAVVTDLIGTPTELVDEAGAVAWRTRSALWGTTTWNTDADAYTPLRFPGQYFDPESNGIPPGGAEEPAATVSGGWTPGAIPGDGAGPEEYEDIEPRSAPRAAADATPAPAPRSDVPAVRPSLPTGGRPWWPTAPSGWPYGT